MDSFRVSPFSRLARAHLFSVAGDALFAIALAGSVFFDVSVDKARWQVTLYLLLTIAPFAAASPLIGPALDRAKGGRRWMVVGTDAARAVLCLLLVQNLDGLAFFPIAFAMLVFAKSYQISKSAVVPTTVGSDEELVEANSKLALISGLAVVLAAGPGFLLMWLGSPAVVVGVASIVFAIAAIAALRLPSAVVAPEPPDEAERAELHSAAVLLSVSAMGVLRGIVGFVAFLVAFALRRADEPIWHLGVAAAAAQIGFLAGAAIAPPLRRRLPEESILVGSLAATAAAALLLSFIGPLPGVTLLSLVIGASSSAGKQGFDAIVQRDAPDANRGRSFARFETRFQLAWVVGALLPVVVPVPLELGFICVAGSAAFAAVSYHVGLRRARHGRTPPPLARRRWSERVGGLLRPGGRARTGADDDALDALDELPEGALPIEGVVPPIDDGPLPPSADEATLSGLPTSDQLADEVDELASSATELPDLDWHG